MATLRDAGITGDFSHEPLSDPQNEIRLVWIKPSDDRDADVECTISKHTIEDAPSYVAISYTWGDTSQRQPVTVDGKRIIVGYNSWLVLWQARLRQVAHPVWLDVFSIDQINDVEKSIQVSRMGTIFRAAEYVMASVGAHANDSQFLADQIQAHMGYMEHLRKSRGEVKDSLLCMLCDNIRDRPRYLCEGTHIQVRLCEECTLHAEGNWEDINQITSGNRARRQWQTFSRIFELSSDSYRRLGYALTKFVSRPYFKRLWIIQELKIARSVVLTCGDSLFQFAELDALLSDFECVPLFHGREFHFFSGDFVRLSRKDFDRETLWHSITTYRNSQCSDPRARVFGLVELTKDRSLQAIRPDYSKSETQVLIQLLGQEAIAYDESNSRWSSYLRHDMHSVFEIVQIYGSSPELYDVATMIHQRRSICHDNKLSLELLPQDMEPVLRTQHRIPLSVRKYCRVQPTLSRRKDVLAPLIRIGSTRDYLYSHTNNILRAGQQSGHDFIRICDPGGTVIALADRRTQPDDILLFFGDRLSSGPPCAGLVVRRAKKWIYAIVGQFIFDPCVEPCPMATQTPDCAYDARCECRGDVALHSMNLDCKQWTVYMSADDLLLFVVQDMDCDAASHGTFRVDANCATRTMKRARRMMTSVTEELLSSYAECEAADWEMSRQLDGPGPKGDERISHQR